MSLSNADRRKVLQLCKQAERSLGLALAGLAEDDLLADLQVTGVLPAPDSSHLLVMLWRSQPTGLAEKAEILAHLERHRGRLRSELAAEIRRRKAPDFTFRLAAPGDPES